MSETREELLAQIAALQARVDVLPVADVDFARPDVVVADVVTDQPNVVGPKPYKPIPPDGITPGARGSVGPKHEQPSAMPGAVGVAVPGGKVAVPVALLRRRTGRASPEEILGQIGSIKSLIISGVDSAGYGDKRTEFRSLTDLRQILNGLEDELADLLGTGNGRIRQIRMTTQADKGL